MSEFEKEQQKLKETEENEHDSISVEDTEQKDPESISVEEFEKQQKRENMIIELVLDWIISFFH